MSCGNGNGNGASCCPPGACPPACCPPIVIKTKNQHQQGQCCVFQLPPVNIVCEIPPPPRNKNPPKVCCIPLVMCEDDSEGQGDGCSGQPSMQPQMPGISVGGNGFGGQGNNFGNAFGGNGNGFGGNGNGNVANGNGNGGCGKSAKREKRFAQCNFMKPCIDGRIYRDGEHMNTSYAGHIPGEQFIQGRNLPTATTFAKRRLCTFTPYDFVDPDGCCSENCVIQ